MSGKLRTRDGTRLFFRRYTLSDMPKANVVLLHSFGEHCGMYEHVSKRLMHSAFCVVAFDQRGYGQSEGRRGHFAVFDKILTDISDIIEHCVVYRDVPTFLYGHCSGGTAAIQYVLKLKEVAPPFVPEKHTEERHAHSEPSVAATGSTAAATSASAVSTTAHRPNESNSHMPARSMSISTRRSPSAGSRTHSGRRRRGIGAGRTLSLEPVDGLIVTSPYLRLTVDSPSWQKKIIQFISKAYKSYLVQADISIFKLTRDKLMQHAIKEDPFRTSDITVKQLVEWDKRGSDSLCRAGDVDLPILVMHGSQDPVTDHRATAQFFTECQSDDKEFVLLPNFLHNVHMEIDRERHVFSKMVQWLNRRSGRDISPMTPSSSAASEARQTSLHDSDDDSIFYTESVSSDMLRNGLPAERRSTAPGTIIAGSHRPFCRHGGQCTKYLA